jgi:tetratricopeptide (TPR) repeat protein
MGLAQRGWAHLKVGSDDKAIADCDAAPKLDPILAIAYSTRGLAHTALGHVEQGEADRRKAVELNPAFLARSKKSWIKPRGCR